MSGRGGNGGSFTDYATVPTVREPICPDCNQMAGYQHNPNCPTARALAKSKDWTSVLSPKQGVPVKGASIEIHLPPEVEQYAGDLRRFFEAMVYKLGVHSGKGRWEDMPIGRALELLRGEEKELTEAVERGNMVEIMLESADVANYALIASAIAMERGK